MRGPEPKAVDPKRKDPKRKDPKRIVAAGYDLIAERYLAWSGLRPSAPRRRFLALADELIPAGADVLELGCGAGLPVTAALARGRRLTGVDISAVQIGLARSNVPTATFVQTDMTSLERPAASLDMFFSHFSARVNRRLVAEAGLEIERAEVVAEPEDRHDARFLWVVARAPDGAAAGDGPSTGSATSSSGSR